VDCPLTRSDGVETGRFARTARVCSAARRFITIWDGLSFDRENG
jgi:hypothetical protein